MLIKVFLFPFSLLYMLGVKIRNYLYDKGILKTFSFELPLIGIGNLRVGGTGKTPHVEYLIRLLAQEYRIATLSRGYGRKTKGFYFADETSTARTIGDEPMQFYRKYGTDVAVAVGEDRAMAIPQLLYHKPDRDLILLDDAFQHRSVSPDINILLSDYAHPFYEDLLLPAGRLRESRAGASRADMVIITKCPDLLTVEARAEVTERITKYIRKGTPVFFTGLEYLPPVPVFDDYTGQMGKKVFLVSGIANPGTLIEKVRREYELIGNLDFPDHYNYDTRAVQTIIKHFEKAPGNDKVILVTEKDMVKLKDPAFKEMFQDIPLFYFPLQIYFLTDKHKFEEMIFRKLEEKKSKDIESER